MNYEAAGDSCSACGFWIQATGDWYCEECRLPTCERCGRVDCEEDLFLCPDCFSKEVVSTKPLVYLAGAMEKAGPYGAQWREDITPHLEKLGYSIWNPYIEEAAIDINPKKLSGLKRSNYETFKKYCRKIVDYDLEHLKKCAVVVCRLDWAVQLGAGTYGELTVCHLLGIPVYAWIDRKGGVRDIPGWAMGCVTKYSCNKEEFYQLIPSAERFTNK